MSITDILVPTAVQMLGALSAWLDKGAGYAEERGDKADDLLALRLAPDMYPLAGQVRFAAFMAQEPVHRLRGEAPPEHLEEVRGEGWISGEKPGTLLDARSRIDEALILLRSVGSGELDVAADRPIALELPNGIVFDMVGSSYVRDWALPQFYFHLITAYAILRNHGVALGKVDYVPQMFAYVRPGTIPG
jgi:uncharacterized protein